MPSGNERWVPFFWPFPSGKRKSFCEIFLYPTQVTLSVSKKKLRYTTCKCILNVTVNCPYSKAPQPTPFVERRKIMSEREKERERERERDVCKTERLIVWINYVVVCECVTKCEDTFVRLSYFFPGCKMEKMKILSNDFCTPMIVMYRSYTYDYYYYDYDYYLHPLDEKERDRHTARLYIYIYIYIFVYRFFLTSPCFFSFFFVR